LHNSSTVDHQSKVSPIKNKGERRSSSRKRSCCDNNDTNDKQLKTPLISFFNLEDGKSISKSPRRSKKDVDRNKFKAYTPMSISENQHDDSSSSISASRVSHRSPDKKMNSSRKREKSHEVTALSLPQARNYMKPQVKVKLKNSIMKQPPNFNHWQKGIKNKHH
jgi:hypothetical protein